MAILTPTAVSRAGNPLTSTAASAGGDSFPNTGKEFLVIKNGGAAAITVTLDIQQTVDGQAVTDKTVSVAAGATVLIGPFPTGIYNDANGRVNITYSSVTNVTVDVFSLSAVP